MSGARFGWRAHLRKPDEFRRVFRAGRRITDSYFTVIYAAGGAPESRLGLVVARRHVKRAVDRNRIKRIVRESFRHHRPNLGRVDIVVNVRAAAGRASNGELFASVSRALEQVEQQCAS